jgi:hypothetical protein
MPVDPTEFGGPDFGFQGSPFDPRTETTVNDPATDYGFEGSPHPVMIAAPPPAAGGGGVVIFFVEL